MPFSNRPFEHDGNGARRFLRGPITPDFKRSRAARGNNGSSRQAPPESTSAENFYYLKQMSAKTPMVIVLTDGEELHGWIEWYDRAALKLNREGAPNLLLQKHCIKYMYKADEAI